MNIRPNDEKPIRDQAAYWSGVLHIGGAREHAEFAAWLKESPHHVREFLLLTAMEKEIERMDLQDLDVEEILTKAQKNVVEWRKKKEPSPLPSPKGRGRKRAVAAAILAAAIGALTVYWLQYPQTYATAIGEQRTIELADGSVVQLSPLSRISVKITDRARDVQLLSGEALFKVKHETQRPFFVQSGATLIEDLGTQFHVYRRSSGTVVSVIEGAVQVVSSQSPAQKPVRIDAGQEARTENNGKTIKRSRVDTAQLNAWKQRHLTFSGDTLSDIAADFNRYNRSPQIRIEGDALRERRYSGGFDADDPESLVEYLRQSDSIAVERQGDELVIRPLK